MGLCAFMGKVKASITIDEDVLKMLKSYCRESGAKISSTINAAVKAFLNPQK